MKTATIPSLRVTPELREAAESVLNQGESLSAFVETSVREAVQRRRTEAEFLARGLAAREAVRGGGAVHTPERVHGELRAMLEGARRKLNRRSRG
jgi:hypothetical protein